MKNSKLSPANLVILIAGVVIFIGSFLAFYKSSGGGLSSAELQQLRDLGVKIPNTSSSVSAWDRGLFLFTALPALLGLIMAAQVALTAFANVNLPDRVLGLTWNQVHLALGFQAALMMICYLVVDKGSADWGAGFFLMLIASIALLAGAIMREREAAPAF
jgi:hypothetical protein